MCNSTSTGTNVLLILCRNIAAIGLMSANARIRNTSNRIMFIGEFNVLVYGNYCHSLFSAATLYFLKSIILFFLRKTTFYTFFRGKYFIILFSAKNGQSGN